MLLKRLFREHPLGAVGAAIILVLILVSVFADVLAPFRFGEMNLDDLLACRHQYRRKHRAAAHATVD